MAATYLKHLDPACLRYYYASKLGPRLDDLDLNLEEFVDKVNSDLVGKVVNLASRTAKFVQHEWLVGEVSRTTAACSQQAPPRAKKSPPLTKTCDYARAMRLIMELADRANRIHRRERALEARQRSGTQPGSCRTSARSALNLFRQIVVYLAPVLPKLAEQAGELLNEPITNWEQSQQPLVGTPVAISAT